MGAVYWLSQHLADLPPGSAWLSGAERAKEAGFRVPKRRSDWRLGRWTAKRALLGLRARGPLGACPLEHLARFEVRPTPKGAPQAFWEGERLPWSLSISHSGGRALVAVDPSANAVGCDIEGVERRSAAFLEECFTRAELDAIAASSSPEVAATLYWSAKESLLKALGEGLRRALPGLAVSAAGSSTLPSGWRALRIVELSDGRPFAGCWRRDGDFILTLVASTHAPEPVALVPFDG
jgi:4'-phosphopantetheinyl transferase